MSPYLFLLCVEGLSCLFRNKGSAHLAKGVRVGVHVPWVSHLLFADDRLAFTHVSSEGAARLQEILELYRLGSGQLVNQAKSTIFFSGNCSLEMKDAVHMGSGITEEALVEKYLGLPTTLNCSTDEQFDHIATKMKKFVQGWSPKLMSSSAIEVLIKSMEGYCHTQG